MDRPAPGKERSGWRDAAAGWSLGVLAFVAVSWRFGYGYASGDQDEVLPLLLHTLDPAVLANDWFVGTQTADFSVRTYFVRMLWLLAQVMPVWMVILAVDVLCFGVLGHVLYRIGQRMYGADARGRLGAALGTFAALALTYKWTLGSNDLVYAMLVPEMAAWPLALYAGLRISEIGIYSGVEEAPRGRLVGLAVLLGVAAWFQVLVALQVGVLTGCALLVGAWQARKSGYQALVPVVLFVAVFGIASLPASVPLFVQQVGSAGVEAEPDVFYLIGPFRNPFHHMPFSFSVGSYAKFGLVTVLGLAAAVVMQRSGRLRMPGVLWAWLGVIAVALGIGTVFTEFVPVLLVAKLQLFKLTVVAKALFVLLIGGGLASLISVRWATWVDARSVVPVLVLGTGLLLVGSFVLVAANWEPAVSRVGPLVHQTTDLGRMEAWIQQETAPDAVFAVPPATSTFRSTAQRGAVVTYASYPYKDSYMQDWYRRMLAIAPIDPPQRGMGLKPVLDAAYHTQTAEDWRRLAPEYGIDYVLTRDHQLAMPLVHEVGPWQLYRVD